MTDEAPQDEVPDWAKLWLDIEVAEWLHRQADDYFDGNVERALNETLRLAMERQRYWRSLPDDPSRAGRGDPWERLMATLPPVAYRKRQRTDEPGEG